MGNNEAVKIHVFVAALVFSRRIFAKAYPAKNQTAWLDGIKSAFFFLQGASESVCLRQHQMFGSRPQPPRLNRMDASLLLVRRIIRSQKVRWKEQCAMYKAMPCKANRSKVRRQSIIGWSTGP